MLHLPQLPPIAAKVYVSRASAAVRDRPQKARERLAFAELAPKVEPGLRGRRVSGIFPAGVWKIPEACPLGTHC